jgi:hypothetical protein
MPARSFRIIFSATAAFCSACEGSNVSRVSPPFSLSLSWHVRQYSSMISRPPSRFALRWASALGVGERGTDAFSPETSDCGVDGLAACAVTNTTVAQIVTAPVPHRTTQLRMHPRCPGASTQLVRRAGTNWRKYTVDRRNFLGQNGRALEVS